MPATLFEIRYYEADFVRDELPAGFDLVLDCDVGAYDEGMLRKLGPVLRSGGRLVIVDQFAPAPGVAPPSYMYWAFLASMANPTFTLSTVAEAQARLQKAGFQVLSARPLRPLEVRWVGDWTMMVASRGQAW